MSHVSRYRNGVRISERQGAGEWTLEKLSLLLLMPLGVWVASTAFTLAGAGHGTVMQWFARPLNSGLVAATALTFIVFANLAWKVIVEDYIHKPGSKAFLLGLLNLICLVLAAASVFFIVRLALGSAPLPAGFGI